MIGYICNHRKDRQLVVWGTGHCAHLTFDVLRKCRMAVDFFIDSLSGCPYFYGKPVFRSTVLNKEKHYVVIATSKYSAAISDELERSGCVHKQDYCFFGEDFCEEDFVFENVHIGKHTTGFIAYADCLGICIASIGRYTAINETAYMHRDHLMSISTNFKAYNFDPDRTESLKAKYPAPLKEGQVYRKIAGHYMTEIGNDVWIGAHTFINASRCKSVGNGAIIAAGAVVNEDVPPYAVVAGVPAKIKKYRFTERRIEILQKVKWWDWSDEKLKENAECFYNPDMFFEKHGDI